MPDAERKTAEDIIFNANLQEFAQRVGFICGLEANHKLESDEAYRRIKALWKQLKSSKKNLRIGQDDGVPLIPPKAQDSVEPPEPPEPPPPPEPPDPDAPQSGPPSP